MDAIDNQVKDSDVQLGIYYIEKLNCATTGDKKTIDKSNFIEGDSLRHAKPRHLKILRNGLPEDSRRRG